MANAVKNSDNVVTIKANDKNEFVNLYANKEFGYLVLTQSKVIVSDGWIRESVRTTLQRGTSKLLEMFVANATKTGMQLTGNIVVEEYLEDAIPPHVAKANLRDDVTFEEAIKGFLKRAGTDGPVLTKDGKRIVRFTKWDPTGLVQDVLVQHDSPTK